MKKNIIILLVVSLFISCENDFSDWNVDEKNPSNVPAYTLVGNAERNLARMMRTQSVNSNIFNFFSQYWTPTLYTDEANYDLTNRDIPGGFWNWMYRNVLVDLKDAKGILESQTSSISAPLLPAHNNKIAITNVLEIYTYHVLVDVFGDVPYNESLSISDTVMPAYDDDAAIYESLFTRLDEAINMFSTSDGSFGDSDLFYQGDAVKWKKFANSLKLRMALRVKDGDKISEAIASGVFTSNDDNFAFPFLSSDPYSNPLWENLVRSNRHDLVVSEEFVNTIVPLNDPRTSIYLRDNLTPYQGSPYGAGSAYTEATQLGDTFHQPDLEGVLMDYSEVEFLLAEAAARNLGGVTSASTHYDNAITASINYWNPSGDAAVYIAQASVAYDATNWAKSIGTQKWIALYSRGFESWSSWRMLGYPELQVPSTAKDVAEGQIPVRYTYPADESQRNSTNYNAASAAIGGDKLTSKVFWDN